MKRIARTFGIAAIGLAAILVSCQKEKAAEPKFLSFGFFASENAGILSSDYQASINGTSISVALPPTVDKSSLTARFTVNDGNIVKVGAVEQVSGRTKNDFSSNVTYSVTGADGKQTVPYSVSITLGPDPKPALTAFSFNVEQNSAHLPKTAEGTFNNKDITVGVPQTADVSELVATFATPQGNRVTVNGVEQVSGVTVNDFSSPVDYIVTNSDGSANAMFSVTLNRVKGEWSICPAYEALPVYSGAVLKVNPDNNLPYLAFKEREISGSPSETANRLSVVKFDGTSWSQVGAAGIAKQTGSEMDFDFSPDGMPFIAFQNDENSPNKSASVVKYDGSWKYVGDQATSDMASTKVRLAAFSDKQVLMVQVNNATKNSTFARRIMVMSTWDGAAWTNSENPALPAGNPAYDDFVCKAGGMAFVAMINRATVDGVNYGHNVLQFKDNTWTALRTNYLQEGASQTGIAALGLAAKEDGTVYLMTSDDALSAKNYQLRVEKYDPVSKKWSTLGGNPIEHVIESHNYARIALAPDGTPFVAYHNFSTHNAEVVHFDDRTKQWTAPVPVGNGKVSGELGLGFDAMGTGYLGFIDGDNHYQLYKFQ